MAHLTLNTAVARKLVQRIEELIADTTSTIMAGNIQTIEKYREQIGIVQGLRRAIQAVEETEAEISNEGTT